VDVLFGSVADTAGANAVGVILTGMGSDGAAGLLRMRHAGAATIGQDEESCLIYGMPRAAEQIGAVDVVLPLSRIAGHVLGACAPAQ
jgi:two-component system chemotaxis response regulator CheB